MDALSEVLRVLKLTGGLFLEAEFAAPWCVDSAPGHDEVRQILPDAEHVVLFHLLTQGSCRVRLSDGGETVGLEQGDLILFPHGDAHRLGSDVHLAPVGADGLVERSAEGGIARIRHGGSGERTRFVCGYLACDKRLCRPLLGALPRMLRVPIGNAPGGAWMTATLLHGASESHAPRPGGDALMGRLSEILFVEAIREYLHGLPPGEQGWLAGLRDPHVGKALALMHANPAHGWEVETLAREAGLSRSTLAERFASLIGEPPMQYLTGWRLALAAQALSGGNDAVARVAERVGYESEAAFSRAFKREFGAPPAAWRRSVRAARRVAA